ncbi:TPA: transcriptional regulator, partial [Streptococcus pneumoniae]
RKMFAGEFHYPSELNRLYQKIRHYKMEQRMPQSPWVERIVQILDLDYEDLFRR